MEVTTFAWPLCLAPSADGAAPHVLEEVLAGWLSVSPRVLGDAAGQQRLARALAAAVALDSSHDEWGRLFAGGLKLLLLEPHTGRSHPPQSRRACPITEHGSPIDRRKTNKGSSRAARRPQ